MSKNIESVNDKDWGTSQGLEVFNLILSITQDAR